MYTESEALGRVSCYHFSQKEASRGCYRAPIMKWAMENCLIEIGIPSWRSSKPEPSCQFPGPRVLAPTTEYRSVSVSLHRSLHHLRSCPQNGNGGEKSTLLPIFLHCCCLAEDVIKFGTRVFSRTFYFLPHTLARTQMAVCCYCCCCCCIRTFYCLSP